MSELSAEVLEQINAARARIGEPAYGVKRDYRKINIYRRGGGPALCTTTWARTCKEALQVYAARYGDYEPHLKAHFRD